MCFQHILYCFPSFGCCSIQLKRLTLFCIFMLGISLCHRLSSLTVFSGIFHFLSSSSGALVLRQTFIMLWYICFWVPLMILVRMNYSGAKDPFRYDLICSLFCAILFCLCFLLLLFKSLLLQIILLLLALIAVPWMLFPKPFILRKIHTEVKLSLPSLAFIYFQNIFF